MRLRPTDGVTVRPLFYDALSGEFTAPTEERKRLHTLGRLSFVSYQKGDWVEDGSRNVTIVQYVPTWAQHVTVRTRWLENDFGVVLSRMSLATQKGGKLALSDEIYDNEIHIHSGENDAAHFKLEMGENLKDARDVVTEKTQAFFDVPA